MITCSLRSLDSDSCDKARAAQLLVASRNAACRAVSSALRNRDRCLFVNGAGHRRDNFFTARGLRFLRSTANRAYDYKNVVRTPDFKDRLSAASAAKKAQIERARAIADDPARLRRIEARSEIIAARNIRIAERERVRREAIAREAAERAAAEAAEAAALEAARKAEEEAREARLLEQARLDAAAAAKLEALLAIRRAGRKKKKKRKGH